MPKTISTFILSLLFLASCDYPNYVHYTITNNTSENLEFDYKYKTRSSKKVFLDSTLQIPSKQIDTLFTVRLTSPRVYYTETDDTIKHLLIKQVNSDTEFDIIAKSKLTQNWTFTASGRNVASMNFIIKE